MDQAKKARFRYAAAGLIKSLIRARIVQESDFLSEEDRRRWGVEDAGDETRSCAELLTRVRQLQEDFEDDTLSGQVSVPSPSAAGEADSIDKLVSRVASFIVGDLKQAALSARRSEPIGWDELALWEELEDLRNALDGLPKMDDLGVGTIKGELRAKVPKFIFATNHPKIEYRDLAVAINKAILKGDTRSQNEIAKSHFEQNKMKDENWKNVLAAIRRFERDHLDKSQS